LAGVLGIGEGHLLHRKTRRVIPGILSKSGSLLQDFPKGRTVHCPGYQFFRVGRAATDEQT
ncbi:hypothetical protein, partial [Pseudomonas putida]|uniref:hypothetical protein n=1 Tax=Pseudomonas putida TaxID=303 RepID=UPI002B2540A9